jgi:hypothetical protein
VVARWQSERCARVRVVRHDRLKQAVAVSRRYPKQQTWAAAEETGQLGVEPCYDGFQVRIGLKTLQRRGQATRSPSTDSAG